MIALIKISYNYEKEEIKSYTVGSINLKDKENIIVKNCSGNCKHIWCFLKELCSNNDVALINTVYDYCKPLSINHLINIANDHIYYDSQCDGSDSTCIFQFIQV